MRRLAAAMFLTLVIACSGSPSSTLAALPPRTCALLEAPLTAPEFGIVAAALPAFVFRGGRADVIVYVNADAPDNFVDALRAQIESDSSVKSMTYLDHDAAYAEFSSLFSNQPAIAKSLTPNDTPTSFTVVLTDLSREE